MVVKDILVSRKVLGFKRMLAKKQRAPIGKFCLWCPKRGPNPGTERLELALSKFKKS